jgi:multidrug transporter EmrE-like cation transporter
MHTSMRAILFFAVAAFLGALGQYLFKTGVKEVGQNMFLLLTSLRIWFAVFLYFLVMVLFIMGFKAGGELTVLYPVYATTFIWAALIGRYLLNEAFSLEKALGMFLIIFGVFFIAK